MKKTALVALAVLVALALVGVGYALWSETLFIDGTVETGSLDIDYAVTGTSDTEPVGKDVSAISAAIDPATGVLTGTITNAYPGIDYYCDFTVTNIGSIPLHTENLDLWSTLPVGASYEIYAVDSTGAQQPFAGWQVHPGQTVPCRLHIYLDNTAEMGTLYNFGASLTAVQWNESIYVGVQPQLP